MGLPSFKSIGTCHHDYQKNPEKPRIQNNLTARIGILGGRVKMEKSWIRVSLRIRLRLVGSTPGISSIEVASE
jgi:hypothetical protein